jgi:hypothetical protein
MPKESDWMREEQAHLQEITRLGCIACRLLGRGFKAIQVYYIQRQSGGALGAFGLCDTHHAQYIGLASQETSEPGRWETLLGSEDELITLAETLLALKRVAPSDPLSEAETKES